MLSKKKLIVFPTSRAIREYISKQKGENSLLPFILTIDEFLKKSIKFPNMKYCEEEQRVLFLSEAVKNIDLKKLGISNNFTKFLKQSDYIYRFFLELSSEKIDIDNIQKVDIYDFYDEHLQILKEIRKNYLEILNKNRYVDRINLADLYQINNTFLEKFEKIELYFEGYFTKVEFEIIEKISKHINLNINFYSNEYNKKSLQVFTNLGFEIKENFTYKINLTNQTILEEYLTYKRLEKVELKAFSSRLNQIGYIKSCITESIKNGIDASKIALVLPDEKFVSYLQLFDNEKYFNYAMGKNIKQTNLYQIFYAIFSFLNEDEMVYEKNLEFVKIDKIFIENEIKVYWNKNCTKNRFESIINYVKSYEDNIELIEKFDELIYKLSNILFTDSNNIVLKDIFKILLQKLSKITLDDVNSGKITVLGLLETRAIEFDVVIICDFNESNIPKISLKDKFLSTKIKELSNLPTQLDREALQKYYYKRLIDGSKYTYISYVNSDTDKISRFANELFNQKIDTTTNDQYYKHILYNNHDIFHSENEIVDSINLSQFIWSATSLKVYLECKRKFYLQYILKINEHTISLKPKSFELGNIIHNILEEYYKDMDSSNDFTFERLEDLFSKYKTANPFLILDLEIWKKKLYDFYQNEVKRLKNRKVLELEKEFSIKFEDIYIKGKIDRIDLFDNRYEVIDYKTSSSLSVDTLKNYEKTTDFQLEFYYIAIKEIYKISDIDTYYYDLNDAILLNEVALLEKVELLKNKFKEIKEISNKEISFIKCEDKSNCQYCPYKIICDRE